MVHSHPYPQPLTLFPRLITNILYTNLAIGQTQGSGETALHISLFSRLFPVKFPSTLDRAKCPNLSFAKPTLINTIARASEVKADGFRYALNASFFGIEAKDYSW